MAKSVYQSCMNKEKIEARGFDPLRSVLKKLGGWPLLEGRSWHEVDFKWYEVIYKLRELGFSTDYLINFSVTTDLKNSSRRILDLDQPGLGMAHEYLMKGLEDPIIQVNYIENTQIIYKHNLYPGLLHLHERCCNVTWS